MTEGKSPIYSVGHGTRKIEIFISLLKEHQIEYLIDVRSKPMSRFNPQYNQKLFSEVLQNHGIRYVFMGESLGGRPSDNTCYDAEGHIDYEKTKEKQFFLAGINRLQNAFSQNLRVACMCSEISPCDCHRSKLIGVALELLNIPMLHINKDGHLEKQSDVMDQVIGRDGSMELFEHGTQFLKSRKSYK